MTAITARVVREITHRCTSHKSEFGGSCDRQVPCDGVRYSDGTGSGGCGEPCSWIMGKAGYGEAPGTLLDMRRARDVLRKIIEEFDNTYDGEPGCKTDITWFIEDARAAERNLSSRVGA